MGDKLDFNAMLKRGNDRFNNKERQIPSDLYQCIVFYARPVKDELFEDDKLLTPVPSLFKKNYNKIVELNESLEKQKFVFPFYSREIFGSSQEATNFIPIFVRQLINERKIPETVIKDGKIDDSVLEVAITQLNVTILEQEKQEFKGF